MNIGWFTFLDDHTLTIENQNDVKKYKLYKNVADILLFDSKGYEKSMSFEHSLLENIKFDKEVMLAGDIQINDNFENFKKIANIIDISGGLETAGLKDISKIAPKTRCETLMVKAGLKNKIVGTV